VDVTATQIAQGISQVTTSVRRTGFVYKRVSQVTVGATTIKIVPEVSPGIINVRETVFVLNQTITKLLYKQKLV